MSKTAIAIAEIGAGIALMVLTFGAGAPLAAAWGAQAASVLFSVGLSAGITGVFGLLQPLLNPNDLSIPGSQQNYQNAAAFRRVIYGFMEVGGVLTFDSAPAGDGAYQNSGPTGNWRHQVYTVASHKIASFERGGKYHVIIDGVDTPLALDTGGSGYYFPEDVLDPYGGVSSSGPHIGFEFDLGEPGATAAFPALALACSNWTTRCIQAGCAKVHVAMRYDYDADGSRVGTDNMVTSAPIYVNGRVPSFRFQLMGKPLLDTRSLPGRSAGQHFDYLDFIVDPSGNIELQLTSGGGTTGGGPVVWAAIGSTVADGGCLWLNLGPLPATRAYGYVTDVEVLDGGSYSGTPDVILSGGGGSGADAYVSLMHFRIIGDLDGQVRRIAVSSPGLNYTSAPRVSFSGDGSGATAVAHARIGRTGWLPAHAYSYPALIVDSNGNLQWMSLLAGFTSAATQADEPGWKSVVGQVTNDNGSAAWTCIGRASEVFTVAANSSNPALVVYDYLTDSDYGLGVDPADIDVDSVNAAANICEETVVVNIAGNGGSLSENRYDCNGLFDHSAARGDVLKSLVGSMAGTVIPPGDQWHLYAGAYASPTATLTDADLRDSIKGDFRISRRDICNGVKGSFIPAFLPCNTTQAIPGAWRWTDFPPYQGNGLHYTPNYLGEDGGEIIWKETRFGFTTSIWMVQRLAKILLQMLRFQVTLNLMCKLTAFPVQAGDTITFIHARWAALASPVPTTFFVTQATLVIENKGGAPALGVDLVLRQHDPSIYDFTAPLSLEDQGEYSSYASLGTYGG